MECVKNLDCNTEESFGVWGVVCIESKLWNWGDPTLHSSSCKVDVYKPKVKLQSSREGVGGEHSTKDRMDNITILREGSLLCSSFLRR